MSAGARRLAIGVYGVLLLVWLGLEDASALPPALLGAAGALLLLTARLPAHLGLWMVRGALVGGGAALGAALLMLLKTGWHAHLIPDYPASMIVEMLARAPLWAAAGALAGVGVWLIAPRSGGA